METLFAQYLLRGACFLYKIAGSPDCLFVSRCHNKIANFDGPFYEIGYDESGDARFSNGFKSFAEAKKAAEAYDNKVRRIWAEERMNDQHNEEVRVTKSEYCSKSNCFCRWGKS